MAASSDFADLRLVRDIGIAAHIDAGKTTLTERILYYTGANHKIGEVHDGQAHMDWMDEERAHGITITSAVAKCPWKDHVIQVVDTPGHVDFTIEVERAMRILDGAVVVLDGVRGVEPQTETVWRQASRFRIPTLFFVNKMDRPGADFQRAMETIQSRLSVEPVPVTVPVDDGVLHLIEEALLRFRGERGEVVTREPVPAHLQPLLDEERERLLLSMGEFDDTVAEAVLEGMAVTPDYLWKILRQCTLDRRLFPVFGGSALRNVGVQPLLDAIIDVLPSPLHRHRVEARSLDGDSISVEMDPSAPLVALAFKVQLWDGRRHVFARLYRGTLNAGDTIAVAGQDLEERVARVFDVDAGRKKRLKKAVAGQIVLLAGLRKASTGDTLCDPRQQVLLERIDSREPVLALAVEPDSAREEEKMLAALEKVLEEDPTLRFETDEDTGQAIIKGMGELHLQIVFERIRREFGVDIRFGRPHVVSRETVAASATARGFVEQVFEVGDNKIEMKAGAQATVRPRPRDSGMLVDSEPGSVSGGPLSAAQRRAVELGSQDALVGGPLDGAPLQDLSLKIDSVELFGQASSAQAIRIAVAQAVRNALAQAQGQLLGPVMKLEVVVPEESLGTVLGDLQARRASIMGSDTAHGLSVIQAECSLQRLLGYATDLRSLTRGRGQFTSEFLRFDITP